MNIFDIGTEVKIRAIGKTVKITDILISKNKVIQYNCLWWSDGIRYTDFIDSSEIVTTSDMKRKEIGFK